MSIELEWEKLDSSLANTLVDLLNRQLANTPRPSFIGPVEVTSLEFGSTAPDVELVDVRDIYRDFLEADEDEEDDDRGTRDPVKVTEGASDDDAFEWVSRKATRTTRSPDLPTYHPLSPHGRGPAADVFASTPALQSPRDIWHGTMSSSIPNLANFRPATFGPPYRVSEPATPPSGPLRIRTDLHDLAAPQPAPLPPAPSPPHDTAPKPTASDQPNLQLHFHITWPSDLRMTLTTSLLINYPSPMFMSLPIKLSVTGLLFVGEVAVAYEGERRRVHLCILDDLDPYGPAGERLRRDILGTPPELDEDSPSSSAPPSRPGKPLPIGQRLLPNIYIESEIGQADKHVLKNVTRVERFIQDVIRKTAEEELVFPNFHTLVLPES